MIKKETAHAHGIKTIDTAEKIAVQKNEKLEALKNLAPELINSDGQLDVNALQDFVDIANTTSNNKGYELTFAGKGIARAKADTETKFELQFEPAQSKNAVIHNNPVGTNPRVCPKNNQRVCPDTENTVIRGDNLEVLKILKQNYFEKIKMIYIDPPYNTKSENFIYNDNFKESEGDLLKTYGLDEEDDKETLNFLQNVYGTRSHSGWLAFMYPRLKLARDLLKEDGVIFISIDDNEQANLKILCDEIFGEENFLASLVWESNKNIMKGSSYIRKDHEYIICYRKSNQLYKIRIDNENLKFQNPDNDTKGEWLNTNATYTTGGHKFSIKLPNGDYCERNWRFTKKDYLDNKVNLFFNGGNVPRLKIYKDDYNLNNKTPSSLILNLSTTTTGKNNLASLFKCLPKNLPFDNPKDTNLINHLIKMITTPGDLILDFFAGSGTTGDAVMQLNAEDGGNRKFILVQWDEAIKEKTEAYKFCTENNFKPVISSITIERLNRAGEKLLEKNNGQKLDVGYKVFSLTEKPKLAQQNGLFAVENERQHTADKLYNMLCATGKPLHTAIKTLVDEKLFLVEKAEGEEFLYVLGEIDPDTLSGYDDAQIYIDGWADISLENWLNIFGFNEKDKERVGVVY